jgi:rSAM-associated Gly-rich repeat protein
MSNPDRRQFLRGLLGTLVQGAGSVLLASSVAKAARRDEKDSPSAGARDIEKRADQIAETIDGFADGDVPIDAHNFLNFGIGSGWGNGGWPNGGWPNFGWGNGGWRNGGFRNGGWRNGGFSNGGFRNGGGWRNGGWRNR